MSRKYTPAEAAIKVLQKTEQLIKSTMAGLTSTTLTSVPGVISPIKNNSATPMKVGSQAVVKAPKAKKMGQATDKPSVFFGKSEEKQVFKKPSIIALHEFLIKKKGQKRS